MKRLFVIGCLTLTELAYSQATNSLNLAIPIPQGQYQSDHIRADNVECSMAIGSGTNVEFGVLGIAQGQSIFSTDPMYANGAGKQVGVYGRITIPIGAPKTRLDCDRLYQLELTKKKIEVERLQAELANLRALRFESNDTKPKPGPNK